MDSQKFNCLLRKISTDSRAFEEIYNEFYGKVKLHIIRTFGNLVSADDVTQEVFLSLLSLNLKENIEFPTTWLMKISENKAKDVLRVSHDGTQLTDIPSASFCIDNVILQTDMQAIMQKLDALTQQIIYMHIWEGYSYKEIARELNISNNNVRVKAARAYKKIKKLM